MGYTREEVKEYYQTLNDLVDHKNSYIEATRISGLDYSFLEYEVKIQDIYYFRIAGRRVTTYRGNSKPHNFILAWKLQRKVKKKYREQEYTKERSKFTQFMDKSKELLREVENG